MRGISINSNWKFNLDNGLGYHLADLNDNSWRTVNLPHDWSVEFPFDKDKGEACTGFLLGGIAWYRKHFITTNEMINNKVIINFDGIYNNASVYVNNKLVSFHPYGYSPLLVDVTDYLHPLNTDNVIAVKVDHSRYADSRWYTGSGIYRKVSMYILPEVHIPVWGTVINTLSSNTDSAEILCKVNINNDTFTNQDLVINTVVKYSNEVVKVLSTDFKIQKESGITKEITFSIDNPVLWDVYKGNMYTLEVSLESKGNIIQRVEEKFGIRNFDFTINKGFYLNGNKTLIQGVCLHHDAGLVGAAVPLDVWKRRLETLKEAGCNAIRTAHNPSSEDFLDLCDSMGFLVQLEFFDEWDNPKDKRKNGVEKSVDYITRSYTEHFTEFAKSDLQNTLKRDINHPSIVQWSIGNEIEWTYTKYNDSRGFEGDEAKHFCAWKVPPNNKEQIRAYIDKIPRDYKDIDTTAKKLSQWVKELDTTRPVTANCVLPSVSYESGMTDYLDIVGFSYRNVLYKYAKENYPDKIAMGTENFPQWHEWKAVLDNENIAGTFLWTGIDHMGEAWVQKPWPAKGSNLGLLDLAGFKKPAYHLFKSAWNSEPHIKIYTQRADNPFYRELAEWEKRTWFWHDINEHWNYHNGENIVVEVYSNLNSLELFLNEKSMGVKQLSDFDDNCYRWYIPFSQGTLKVSGLGDNKEIYRILETQGELSAINLTSDKNKLKDDSDSVAHIVAQLVDINGNNFTLKEEKIEFTVTDNAKILGVDNGHPENVESFQNNSVTTSSGRCLLIIQRIDRGNITIQAKSCNNKLVSNRVEIKDKEDILKH